MSDRITVPGWMNSCTSRVTKVSLVRSGTRNVRARPLPLSTIPNTHAPRLYLRLCPNIDSSISSVFPLPPSLMLPCRIFRGSLKPRRSSEWCRRAGQPGSNKVWSHKDAGEKTRWGKKTRCKLQTRASVSKEQLFSHRTAASRPTTTAIDPRQQPQPQQHTLPIWQSSTQTMKDNNCSMANAYRLSGCPRSTLRDFIAIAELKKLDSRAFEIALAKIKESQSEN